MLSNSHRFRSITCFVVGGILGCQAATAELPRKPPVNPAAAPIAELFPLQDVRLLDGPFKDAQDTAIEYLLSLEPDRFLANFRKQAGLKPKAEHYGGWESQGVSGHAGGHYLSGCALAYASTGDRRMLERVNYFVDELAECQKANGDGYVSAIPEGKRGYAEIGEGNIRSASSDLNGLWVPNYTMHKVFAGLRDAYRLAGNNQALEVEKKLADWFERIHANLTDQQMQQIMVAEHGGINETFADLYEDTADDRYLTLSKRFHHKDILEPLAEHRDILAGKHANTQIPKVIGVASRYEITGDEHDQAIADFFWDLVVNHHSYVTGGNCDHEHFGEPDKLNNRLSPVTTETCNVYNMLKLTTHVFGWSPSSKVADFYERAFLNHMRSSQHPDGRVIYNLSLQPGHMKEYQSQYDGFTCCVGTGMENHVKYGEAIYFHDNDTVWVNLFIPSEVEWKDRSVRLRQTTDWPNSDTTRIAIESDSPQTFTLRLRKPYWVAADCEVSINGQPQQAKADDDGYISLRREWKANDVVEFRMPMALRTESMPDNDNRIAVFYGPTVLAADLGPVDDPNASDAYYVPVLVTDNKPVFEWVKATNLDQLQFATKAVGQPRDVPLVPFYQLHDRRYSVYLDCFTTDEWAAREAALLVQKEEQRKLEERTVDVLRVGEMQPEHDHQLTGEMTSAGEALGRKWRHSVDGGWFAFEMKVDPTTSNELHCTYWGNDSGNRVFDIWVNGTKLITQRLDSEQPGEFFDVVYPISREVIGDKESVIVKFAAHPGNMAGGLFGCRTLRHLPADDN